MSGEALPTPTPRAALGSITEIDAGHAGPAPELASAIPPTPTPTPGIELQSTTYHDDRVEEAFSKIFDEKELLIYKTSQGTKPEFFFIQTTTDSEKEVFKALETVAQAYVMIEEIHRDISPKAVEIKMLQTSGKPAGTFRLTPELARELVRGDTPTQNFYIKHVIF